MESNSVPSITLQITKSDADRFLEASRSLEQSFQERESAGNSAKPGNAPVSAVHDVNNGHRNGSNDENPLLFERFYQAARNSKHHYIAAFLERMALSGIPLMEVKLSVLLFANSDKTFKLRHYFEALGGSSEPTLNRQGALALFRSILMALSCCLHTSENDGKVIVEGRPSPERPHKRVKREEQHSPSQQFRACQSPSFDSSLATLRDEEDSSLSNLRREVEEVASFATDELLKFAKTDSVPFSTFGDWYNKSGNRFVPWLELLQPNKWNRGLESVDESSPCSLETEDASPVLISFDFSGSDCPSSLFISISEDNLLALQHLVERTALKKRSAADLCKELLKGVDRQKTKGQTHLMLHRDAFRRAMERIIPKVTRSQWTKDEKEAFDKSFLDFYGCFEVSDDLAGAVNLKELAIGMCFFCAGNKSTKLAMGFELLDDQNRGYLTQDQLISYLRSYLLALVALSFFMPIPRHYQGRPITSQRKKSIGAAVDSGARWTLGHFLNSLDPCDLSVSKDQFTFETFANWYSSGGYNVAPWLELLDLNKVLALINQASMPAPMPLPSFPESCLVELKPRDRMSSPIAVVATKRGHAISRF